MRKFRALFSIPDPEVVDFPFVPSDVAQFHGLTSDPSQAAIDDATWKDLMVDRYLEQLSPEVSIFGQHALYARLRSGRTEADNSRVIDLMLDPARLEREHAACKSLRRAEKEIATLLFENATPAIPWWAGRTWPLPLALVASIAAVTLSPWAWVVTALVCYLLFSNQLRYADRLESWQRSMVGLQMLLRVVSLRGEDDSARAGRINRGLTRSAIVDLVPGFRPYHDWFMLGNVNHYFQSVRLVERHIEFLRGCFVRIANLEADIALARHLLATEQFCWAGRSDPDHVALEAMVHPLLPEAQPLTISLAGSGAFISGQNGVGKSTLLRSVGLNLVAARAFGFCYAQRAKVPDLPVYASMQSEDSLLGAESLYMAELRRARELLAAADGPHPGVYIIDEIFRGTNHLESVSAAAAVLDVLAAKGMVIVSSHNLVLASLLAHRLKPLRVAKGGDGRLALSEGVLVQTNGIALLSERGFGAQVEGNAHKVFDWLSEYLAHPGECSVLAT